MSGAVCFKNSLCTVAAALLSCGIVLDTIAVYGRAAECRLDVLMR